MIEAIQTLFQLRWSNEPKYEPLPAHIKRTFVQTRAGDLELLVCEPKSSTSSSPSLSPSSPPIFFVHGGCGSASVWLDWMTYLYDNNYPAPMFAYSLRNRGASFPVPFFRMVWRVSLDELASDLVACVDAAKSHLSAANNTAGRPEDLVLVAHSAGGGLTQYILSQSLVRAKALCLVGAVPHSGMMHVYINWARHDPWFFVRSLFHLQHPMSPLSTPDLVQGAFFCKDFPRSRVLGFMRHMPPYESMWWPSQMMGRVGAWWRGDHKHAWLDVKTILANVGTEKSNSSSSSSSTKSDSDRICIMSATDDVLMNEDVCRRHAQGYRDGIAEISGSDGVEKQQCATTTATTQQDQQQQQIKKNLKNTSVKIDEKQKDIAGITVERSGGVRLVTVHGAGHHMQNDLQLEQAADALRQWLDQV